MVRAYVIYSLTIVLVSNSYTCLCQGEGEEVGETGWVWGRVKFCGLSGGEGRGENGEGEGENGR